MRPVLFHVHGIGPYDFSSLEGGDVDKVQRESEARGVEVVPTIYLRRDYLPTFRAVLEEYARLRRKGAVPNILGFSMEGPLLGPEGGIPRSGSWMPTVNEWQAIAALGRLGLRYVVIAPDAMALNEELRPHFRFVDLVYLLYDSGVRLALGHFSRENPARSASRVDRLLDFVASHYGDARFNVVTDHLFNDMPRNFKHAWRTGRELERREAELAQFLDKEWTPATIEAVLGPVPAVLLDAALRQRLVPCLNYDGAHVDLAICQRTVEFLGACNLIAITDHTELDVMADEELHREPGSTLWFRSDGVVAAGSRGLEGQIRNMRQIGMSDADIRAVLDATPHAFLAHTPTRRSPPVASAGPRPLTGAGP